VENREEELRRLDKQIEEREREMPLLERVRDIFKKYGTTVSAIFIAARVVIGAIISEMTISLKSVAKGLGNGLNKIAKKTASMLPGLIGQVVSFLFKTTG